MRKIGKRQLQFLEALRVHNTWSRRGGWEMFPQSVMTKLVLGLQSAGAPISAAFSRAYGVEYVERDPGLLQFLIDQRAAR